MVRYLVHHLKKMDNHTSSSPSFSFSSSPKPDFWLVEELLLQKEAAAWNNEDRELLIQQFGNLNEAKAYQSGLQRTYALLNGHCDSLVPDNNIQTNLRNRLIAINKQQSWEKTKDTSDKNGFDVFLAGILTWLGIQKPLPVAMATFMLFLFFWCNITLDNPIHNANYLSDSITTNSMQMVDSALFMYKDKDSEDVLSKPASSLYHQAPDSPSRYDNVIRNKQRNRNMWLYKDSSLEAKRVIIQ